MHFEQLTARCGQSCHGSSTVLQAARECSSAHVSNWRVAVCCAGGRAAAAAPGRACSAEPRLRGTLHAQELRARVRAAEGDGAFEVPSVHMQYCMLLLLCFMPMIVSRCSHVSARSPGCSCCVRVACVSPNTSAAAAQEPLILGATIRYRAKHVVSLLAFSPT